MSLGEPHHARSQRLVCDEPTCSRGEGVCNVGVTDHLLAELAAKNSVGSLRVGAGRRASLAETTSSNCFPRRLTGLMIQQINASRHLNLEEQRVIIRILSEYIDGAADGR